MVLFLLDHLQLTLFAFIFFATFAANEDNQQAGKILFSFFSQIRL